MKRIIIVGVLFHFCILSTFAQFSGQGKGTQTNPYLITNATQLAQMANFLNNEDVYFRLENDVDLTEWINDNSPYNGWQPIGVLSAPFCGALNGQGHTITGLTITRPNDINQGLFGYLSGGSTIQDLHIEAESIEASENLGVLAGQMDSVKISNCHIIINGSVTGKNCVGGLLGAVARDHYRKGGEGSYIQDCSVEGNIYGTGNNIGGVIGYNAQNSTILGCCFLGNVKGSLNVGGLIGLTHHHYQDDYYVRGIIYGEKYKQCKNNSVIGNIHGLSYVGGLVGRDSTDIYSGSKISLTMPICYTDNLFSGSVIGTHYVGGIIGYLRSFSPIRQCLSHAEIEGTSFVGGIVGYAETPSDNIGIKIPQIRNSSGQFIHLYDQLICNVAINPSITCHSSSNDVGRIIGNYVDGTKKTNLYIYDIGANGSNEANRALLTTKITKNGEAIIVNDDLYNGTSAGISSLLMKDNYIAWGWDFDENWNIIENQHFPFKQYQPAPPVIDGKLEARSTTVSGTCSSGGKIYLFYNNKTIPITTECDGTSFSFTTEPLIGESSVLLYAKNDQAPSYMARAMVEKDTTVYITNMKINFSSVSLEIEETKQLTVTILPANSTYKEVIWSSSNEQIVTVNSEGLLTAINAGSATITCASTDGSNKTATCKVTVKEPTIFVNQLTLNPTHLTLERYKTEYISASIEPQNATNKELKWTSNNENVAWVNDKGMVTAVKEGTAIITAKTQDGTNLEATCEVEVIKPTIEVILLKVIRPDTLEVGETYQMRAEIEPDDATDKTLTWESEDDHIVMVDKNGLLTAIEEGETTITCTASNGMYVTVPVVVVAPAKAIGDGSLENPFNALAAIKEAGLLTEGEVSAKQYYVMGKVSGIKYLYTTQRGTATFYLSDDGTQDNQFYVYGSYYLENLPWREGNAQIALGDDIIVYGKLANYNGTLEMSNKENYIYSHNGQTVSGINDVYIAPNIKRQPVYNAAGQRISSPRKGLNIIGRQKVTIK